MWSELATSFQHGNGYTYFMLGLAFLGTVIIFERFIMLQFVFNINFNKFLTNLKKMVRAEDLDRAINLCRNASHTSLPLISLRALEAAETDPSTVRGTIEEEAIEFLPRLEARLGVLPALSTLALLVGILGTIDSLWAAFHSIDVLDTAQKQASIGHGISGALTYTTIGLLVCMVFLTFHQMLKGLAIRLSERIQHGVAVLNNLLVPQEVAYMPMGAAVAAGAGTVSTSVNEQAHVAAPAAASVAEESQDSGSQNESLDETSVEDIKDEEEII